MKNSNKLSKAIMAAIIIVFSSCDSNKSEEEISNNPALDPSSRVIVSVDLEAQELYPFHIIEDSQSGTADISDAQELLKSDGAILVAAKGGYIYANDYSGSTFKKLTVDESGTLIEVGKVPNIGVNGNPLHTFLDQNRILLTSQLTYPEDGVYSYQIINTSTMTDESNGTFALPIEGNTNQNFSFMYATEYVYFEGNIYIPFVESDAKYNALYDTASVAIYNAETMEFVKKISTTKTASLCNGFNPSYTISEDGDLYLASSNTNEYGVNESVDSGIARIKSNTTDFDTEYFLNITEATENHSLGMVYLGNNKAIVQVFNSALRESESDYYVEYYVVNLETKAVDKLTIPSSSAYYSTRRSMDILDNGNAVIVSNNATENALYIYNINTDTVSKGTTYTSADAIVGLKAF